MQQAELDTLKAAILSQFPDLAGSSFSLLTQGWDSIAVVRPATDMPVPEIQLIDGPRVFSRHQKLKGMPACAANPLHDRPFRLLGGCVALILPDDRLRS